MNQVEITDIKSSLTEMLNVCDSFIFGFDISSVRIVNVKIGQWELPKLKHKRKKEGKE